jgi:hypothetical protein
MIKESSLYKTLRYIFLTAACIFVIVPIIPLIFMAFKTGMEYTSTSVLTPPQNWLNIYNFKYAIRVGNLGKALVNTIIILAISLSIQIMFTTMVSYVLHRFDFTGKTDSIVGKCALLYLYNRCSCSIRSIHHDIRYLQQDKELVAFSDISKVLVFNTSQINEKTTRNSAGVQILKQKKGSSMVKIKDISEVSFEDIDYYRTKNIPAVGRYLKEEDKEDRQVALF